MTTTQGRSGSDTPSRTSTPDAPEKQKRIPKDPTIKAMEDLDRIFGLLNDKQLAFVLKWALDKHESRGIAKLITT